ncbi:MAG: MSCRAMM family adhesin SdrC, partial [Candidatus Omnitrophica bacterium]|nr:MSCRAMM family adhesin SdrC [Candidatus Omnitrophota bacterium]
IEGYVFKDATADGIRQPGEPGVEGIVVWQGKKRTVVSDAGGSYRFKGVRGKKAAIGLDTTTIPDGFTPTGAVTRETEITQGVTTRIDFGVATRVEISGVVFHDVDLDGRLSIDDIPVRDVVLRLGGKETTTDDFGRYSLRYVTPGKHELTVDLNTIPVMYIPTVPLRKEFEFFEGSSFQYNIPLKKTSK